VVGIGVGGAGLPRPHATSWKDDRQSCSGTGEGGGVRAGAEGKVVPCPHVTLTCRGQTFT
jgi:hypothetical protein